MGTSGEHEFALQGTEENFVSLFSRSVRGKAKLKLREMAGVVEL